MRPTKLLRQLPALCVLLFLAGGIPVVNVRADSTPEKKTLPAPQWARARHFDLKHQIIDLKFDWAKKQAFGSTTLTLAPFQPTARIALDAGKLTINSVTLSDGKPLKYEYDGGDRDNGLEIRLDRVYSAQTEVTIRVFYRTNHANQTDPNNLWGSFGKGLRFLSPTTNDPDLPRQIWSCGQNGGNRYWVPGYDSPNELVTTEFIATVEKSLTAISGGMLVSTTENPDGTRTFHWKLDAPHPGHLTGFVVGEFTDVKKEFDGIPLHNYGFRDETEAVEASVERLPDMMKFFTDLTGARYPYPSFTQVFVSDFGGGLENTSVATQTENMIDDFRTHADFLYLWDGLEANQLAHQWFGNHLACRDWQHIWLNEGFSSYFDGLYNEHRNGHEEFLLWNVRGDRQAALGDWNAGIRHPIVTRNYPNVDMFFNDRYANQRGAAVLHMLRKHIGEENWRRAIRLYVRENANRFVTTEDFRKAVEAVTGQPMDWFFDQWLYRMGHPTFHVVKKYDAENRKLVLTVTQTRKSDPDAIHPTVEYFAGDVEIEIDGRIERVTIQPKAENAFSFNSETEPKLVNFDFESTWIKELVFDKSLDELLYQLDNDRDILGRRWAMDELVALAGNEKTSLADKTRIHDGFRRVISGNAYWRLRLNALSLLQGWLAPSTETKPVALDGATIAVLLETIKKDRAWVRTAAINFLGMTRDPKYADLYISFLHDESDRVINAAATSLGKSGSPKAFDALVKLKDKPSWKNQSLISALNGLKELRDPRGYDIAYNALADSKLKRWRLPTPVWDLRIAAADTIVALGRGADAYPLILERFRKSMAVDDIHGVFNNVLLATQLGDPRAREIFVAVRERYKSDANAITAVEQYEKQLEATLVPARK